MTRINEVAMVIRYSTDINKLNPMKRVSKQDNFMYYSFVAVIEEEFLPELNGEVGYAWVNMMGLNHFMVLRQLYFTINDKLQTILELHKNNVEISGF